MKKLVVGLLLTLLALPLQAQMFQSVNEDQATLLQDGADSLYCPACGMNLVKFFKTSHALKQPDGTMHQYCSLHCLVDFNAVNLLQAQVVDVAGLSFIPVEEATYVVGSDVPGTMTRTSKYAFADEQAARAFAAEHGGELMDFTQASNLALGAVAKENENIAAKRLKMAEKGRTIYEKMCPEGSIPDFATIAEAKTYVMEKQWCGPLTDAQAQALAIFLAQGHPSAKLAGLSRVNPPRGSKCPVCGMFVHKYPLWAARIQTGDRDFYFDGVKDLMKFYFEPGKFGAPADARTFTSIQVTDYYARVGTDARRAWYVVGSNVYGPMGRELIPFSAESDAREFLDDHGGKQILRFDEITPELIRDLDR